LLQLYVYGGAPPLIARVIDPMLALQVVLIIVGVITGGQICHVTVLVSVAKLPQPSTAVNILVCDLEQPVLLIDPSEEFTVGVPHASVAVAVPSAALIAAADGLHPGGKGV